MPVKEFEKTQIHSFIEPTDLKRNLHLVVNNAIVEAPTQYGTSIARISRINIPYEEIQQIKPYMKIITKKINRDRYLNFAEILEEIA